MTRSLSVVLTRAHSNGPDWGTSPVSALSTVVPGGASPAGVFTTEVADCDAPSDALHATRSPTRATELNPTRIPFRRLDASAWFPADPLTMTDRGRGSSLSDTRSDCTRNARNARAHLAPCVARFFDQRERTEARIFCVRAQTFGCSRERRIVRCSAPVQEPPACERQPFHITVLPIVRA